MFDILHYMGKKHFVHHIMLRENKTMRLSVKSCIGKKKKSLEGNTVIVI